MGGAGVLPIRGGGGGVAVFLAASGLSGLIHLPRSLSKYSFILDSPRLAL